MPETAFNKSENRAACHRENPNRAQASTAEKLGLLVALGVLLTVPYFRNPASPDFPGEGHTANPDRWPGAILPTGSLCLRFLPCAVDSAAPARSRCPRPPANGAGIRVDRVCLPRSLPSLAHHNSATRFPAASHRSADAPCPVTGYGPECLPLFACLARDLLRAMFRAASEIGDATGSRDVVGVPHFGGNIAHETAHRS